MWSLLAVLVSEFRWCFALCLFVIFLVQFGLLGGHFLGNSCPLGWRFVLVVFCLFVVFVCLFSVLVFGGRVCLLIAPVPVHCLFITLIIYLPMIFYSNVFLNCNSLPDSNNPKSILIICT